MIRIIIPTTVIAKRKSTALYYTNGNKYAIAHSEEPFFQSRVLRLFNCCHFGMNINNNSRYMIIPNHVTSTKYQNERGASMEWNGSGVISGSVYWCGCCLWRPWGSFNIKIPLSRYGDFHCKNKTVVKPPHLYNGNSSTGNSAPLYCAAPYLFYSNRIIW